MKMVSGIMLALLLPTLLHAQQVPTHMANMAAQLYQQMQDELKIGQLEPGRQKILELSLETLREMKIHRWSDRPVQVKNSTPGIAEKLELDQSNLVERVWLKDFIETKGRDGTAAALKDFLSITNRALSGQQKEILVTQIDQAYATAFEALDKNYITTTGGGRSVQMKWNVGAEKFFIKVFSEGESAEEEFVTNFSGNVKTAVSDNGKDISLNTVPANNPIRIITAADIERMRANIFGEWKTQDGYTYQFSAAAEEAGEIRPSTEFFDNKINQLKDKIKSIEDTKNFKWVNSDNGKFVRQEKFQRLTEPFEYLGKEYAMQDAEERMAAFRLRVSELEAERDGATFLPMERYDPVRYQEMKVAAATHTISLRVTRPDGYSYKYDQVAFDGRRITARRTFKSVEDFNNEQLIVLIKEILIRDGWEPPEWLELDASVDAETGNLLLEGLVWNLHVTYSSFLGSNYQVNSTHTPYSFPLILKQEGYVSLIAQGAIEGFVL